MSSLDHVRVVLLQPQDAVNIAGTVRAMKNMGLGRLRLVRPCPWDPHRIEGIAHGTRDVVDAIETYLTLDDALADCTEVHAYAGKPRAARWAVVTPEASAAQLVARATDGEPVAVLFGPEDHGLPNEALDRAHAVVTIPTTAHASLNLAQAVLLAAYELHLAAGDASRPLPRPRDRTPAPTQAAYARAFEVFDRTLAAIDFYKTRNPEHVMRTVRSLAFRAAPSDRELELARAMAIEVLRTIDRVQGIFRGGYGRPGGTEGTAPPFPDAGDAT